MTQNYTLPRDAPESARLDEQHQIWKTMIGYPGLLHPRVATAIEGRQVHIADVATGTGAWLVDLAAQSPQHIYAGLDISAAQFPRTSPSNITFELLDILAPVPPKYEGCFDVIHVRLLILGLVGEQWHTAAHNLHVMLRSGGSLQWEEGDFAHMISHSPSDSPCPALHALYHRGLELSQSHGRILDEPTRLPEILGKAGFEAVEERTLGSDDVEGVREGFTRMEVGAFGGISRMEGVEEAERGRLVREADEAVGRGSRYRAELRVVLGRKEV